MPLPFVPLTMVLNSPTCTVPPVAPVVALTPTPPEIVLPIPFETTLTPPVPVVLAVTPKPVAPPVDARESVDFSRAHAACGGDDATDRAVDCTAGLHEDDTAGAETFTAEEPEAVSVTTPVNTVFEPLPLIVMMPVAAGAGRRNASAVVPSC